MMPRRRRRLASRIRNYVRSLLAFLFSNIGLIVLVVGYTVAGAFMFQAIEGASEIERVNNMTLERNNTAQYLWQNVTLALNLFNETALKYRLNIELSKYQSKIVSAVRNGWDGGRSSRQWSFSSAFLYSLTVITSIGYGHLSPRTSWGKVLTIFYALLGMPLFLLYVTNVGQLLARWFKCLYALVCLCRGCPGFARRRVVRLRTQLETSEAESIECPEGWRHRVSESDVTPDYRIPPYPIYHQRRLDMRRLAHPLDARYPHDRGWSEPAYRVESEASDFSYVTFDAQTITVPISVCVAVMVGYIMFGSMIFGLWEKWDQLDGAYFCFISLSSIGFGDFVPGERVYTPRIETSFIVCSLYLMLGIALGAMCFNLMQEQVIHYFAGMKRALKRICRCKR
ncbi:potassium channel subfamily K member 18-like [Papilio machaon]|uniref:potassium channel subfamily K member 18-like n=1 Tax=Papilio machaon TaxID=76193 RepID=UPI001E665AF2|nr:potassium channel subfamily K member 18-like [Papilio machaon]